MEEARTKQCTIETIEPEIFEYFLMFIYDEKLPEAIGPIFKKLYDAASYYEIENLKQICQKGLPKILKPESH